MKTLLLLSAGGSAASGMMHLIEPILAIGTLLLAVATFGLWYVTLQVHRDEMTKMGDHLADANDNMTDVALAEIDAHHTNRTRMRRVHNVRHLARRAARKVTQR